MEAKNYGALVIDIAPDISRIPNYADLNSFLINFSSMKLVTGPIPQIANTTPLTITNITNKIRNVEEGWAGQYDSTNAGYGVVIALVIALLVAFAILFVITYKRIRK